jgi:agmatinase
MDTFDQLAAPGYPVFLGSEITQEKPEDALFHVLPVPYEESVSFGTGTKNGPASILEASWQLETWDGKSNPSSKGIYTHPPVDIAKNTEKTLANISSATQKIVADGGLPIGLGGEHTVTLGIINGLLEAGISDFGIVQIDAHGDLRESYEDNPYSHACVMKRIADLDIPIFQLGVRAICEEEIKTRRTYGIRHLDAEILVPKNVQSFDLPDEFPDKVFFTLDVDGMDPSIFPSTGTPVPGGLGWYQTLALFESVAKQTDIIGFDIMEFSPIDGFHGYQFAAAQLTYKMMGIIERLKK